MDKNWKELSEETILDHAVPRNDKKGKRNNGGKIPKPTMADELQGIIDRAERKA